MWGALLPIAINFDKITGQICWLKLSESITAWSTIHLSLLTLCCWCLHLWSCWDRARFVARFLLTVPRVWFLMILVTVLFAFILPLRGQLIPHLYCLDGIHNFQRIHQQCDICCTRLKTVWSFPWNLLQPAVKKKQVWKLILLADRNIPCTFIKAIFKGKYWPGLVPGFEKPTSITLRILKHDSVYSAACSYSYLDNTFSYYLYCSFNMKQLHIALTVTGKSTPASGAYWQNASREVLNISVRVSQPATWARMKRLLNSVHSMGDSSWPTKRHKSMLITQQQQQPHPVCVPARYHT